MKLLCLLGFHGTLSDTGMHLAGMKQTQRQEQHLFACSRCGRNVVRWALRWPYNLTPEQQKTALSPEEKVKYGV
jgi:hypothetical protein